MAVQLRREDGWLLFEAPLSGRALAGWDRAERLALGAALAGGCKIAQAGANACVLAELPAALDSPERVEAVTVAFARAAALARGGHAPRGATPPAAGAKPDLPALFAECAWCAEERDGVFHLDLGVPGAYVAAQVRADERGLALEAGLVADLPAGPRGEAVAALLLRANRVFRGVRAVLRPEGDARRALLEASLPAAAAASDLDGALGAVAVAARRCAREARALADDEALARAYLAHQEPLSS